MWNWIACSIVYACLLRAKLAVYEIIMKFDDCFLWRHKTYIFFHRKPTYFVVLCAAATAAAAVIADDAAVVLIVNSFAKRVQKYNIRSSVHKGETEQYSQGKANSCSNENSKYAWIGSITSKIDRHYGENQNWFCQWIKLHIHFGLMIKLETVGFVDKKNEWRLDFRVRISLVRTDVSNTCDISINICLCEYSRTSKHCQEFDESIQ